MKRVKKNPHLVLEELVDFRSAKGRFSKPYQAAYALITFPRKRKPYILDLAWLGRRSNLATLQFVKDFLVEYYRELDKLEILKEEKERDLVKGGTSKKPTREKLKYKVKKTVSTKFDKKSRVYRKIYGFNYSLVKKIKIIDFTSKAIIKKLNIDIKNEATKLYKRHKFKDHFFMVKYNMGGLYERIITADLIGKVDNIGFSRHRAAVSDIPYLIYNCDLTAKNLYDKLIGGINNPGYLSRKVEMIVDENGKPLLDRKGYKQYKGSLDLSFFIYGFRIEFVKIMEELL